MPTYEVDIDGQTYEIDAPNVDELEVAISEITGGKIAQSDAERPTSMMPRAWDETLVSTPKLNQFGDVTAKAIEQPLAATKAYAAGITNRDVSPTYQAMSGNVPDIIRRPAAAVGDIAMTGLAGLSTGLTGGAAALAEMIAGDKTQEQRLARDLIMGLDVAVPELAGVTSGAARLGRQVAVGRSPIATRQIGEMTDRMRAARAADEFGVLPSAGMQGQATSMLEGGLEGLPISSGTIQRGTQRALDELQSATGRISEKAGVAKAIEDAGDDLRGGAAKFVSDFQAKSENLYGQVDKYIKPNDLVVAPNTTEALREIVGVAENNPELASQIGLGKYEAMLRGLGDGGVDTAVPYQLVKEMRSTFGEAIGKMSGPLADMSQAKIKRIYATLSEDMRAAAEASGPDAIKAWQRANDYYRSGMQRIDGTLARLTNATTGADAYKRIAAMLMEGNARQSTQQLMQIRKSLPTDAFNTFRSTVIDNLGRARAGAQNVDGDVFSPATFMTNFNKMAPSARKIVFGELEPELTRLASLIDMAKDAAVDINRSRTAGAISTGALITMIGSTNIPAAVGAIAANYLSARALTNKTFLRALNSAAKKDMGPLQRIAGGDGLLAAEASTILRTLAAQQDNQ